MRRVPVLLLLFAIQAACSSQTAPLSARAVQPQSDAPPKPFVSTVESEWKGAKVEPSAIGGSCGQSGSAFVTGDFDGDGAPDVVAPVKRSDGIHLVAGLLHTYDYGLVDVTGAAGVDGESLSVRKHGVEYHVPGSQADFYFGEDTVVLTPCGKTPTAYLWDGTKFEAQPLVQ